MWMCMGIHKYGETIIYYFPKFLEENINDVLAILNKGKSTEFKWYSLLIHMILLHNKDNFL